MSNVNFPSPFSITNNIHINVINEVSVTPMPNFDTMSDLDLKNELHRYGARPLCRVKAIRMLHRIYNATHPVINGCSPLSHRISQTLIKTQKRPVKAAEKAREKRTRTAIANLSRKCHKVVCINNTPQTEMFQNFENNPASVSSSLSSNPEVLRKTFLNWLRLSDQKDLYYELLALNSVHLDRLILKFGDKLRGQKFSQAKFSELLDEIHVTYCVPQRDK